MKTMDVLEIGSTPTGEDCAQVVSQGYTARANKKECRVYRDQLLRLFDEPPEGAMIIIKSNHHEFGTYYEVCIRFDKDNEKATDYAFNVENCSPQYWDEQAKIELATGSKVIDVEGDIPVVSVPMTMDSVTEVGCPHCGMSRSVEPDANYTVTCEGCNKKYKCRSDI